MIFRLFIALVLAAALAALYFFLALNWSYSTGERAGYVQKLSKKGWVCKTWEGELALVSLPGSLVEKFYFTVHDDDVAHRISKLVGKRVSLHYEEKVGLPTTCFGETRYFVTEASESTDGPLGPGAPAPAPAPAPALQAPAVVAPGASAVPAVVAPPTVPVVQTAPVAAPVASPVASGVPALAPALPASR
jgi:hypothetical protein